jgi:Xaa-Pro dipeptidase
MTDSASPNMHKEMFAGWPSSTDSPSYFWQGAETLKVPRSMHQDNRQKVIHAFREKGLKSGIAFIQGGTSKNRDDTDHGELFRQESNFHYLFGVAEPDCFATLNIATGQSTLFIPRLPADYSVWLGKIASPEEFKRKYEVDEVLFVDSIPDYFQNHSPEKIFVYYGKNTDSDAMGVPATFNGIEKYDVEKTTLHEVLFESRVVKSEAELELLRYTNRISSEAHIAVMQQVPPPLTPRLRQIYSCVR